MPPVTCWLYDKDLFSLTFGDSNGGKPKWDAVAVDTSQYKLARSILQEQPQSEDPDAILTDYSSKPTVIFPPPVETTFIANFKSYRPQLDELVKLVKSNKNLRVDPEEPLPSNPEAKQQFLRCRELFNKANLLPTGQLWMDQNETDLLCWRFGFGFIDTYCIDYAYLAKSPAHVVGTLDGYVPSMKDNSFVYRHIEGHWYLKYSFIQG